MPSRYFLQKDSYKKTIFWLIASCAAILLIVYLYIIYLGVHFSFGIEQERRALKESKREYQNLEESYVSLLARFNNEKLFTEHGFVKVSSPQFVSRRTSVAVR